MADRYHAAVVCENGHLLTPSLEWNPSDRVSFCPTCGARALTSCPTCGFELRGTHETEYSFTSPEDAESYCYQCGTAYPWTEARLNAGRELLDLLDELEPEERDALKQSLEDVTRNSPKTEVAATRIRRAIQKIGGEAGDAIKRIAIEVAVEAAKGTIRGG